MLHYIGFRLGFLAAPRSLDSSQVHDVDRLGADLHCQRRMSVNYSDKTRDLLPSDTDVYGSVTATDASPAIYIFLIGNDRYCGAPKKIGRALDG
jgi:hypothetical protein